MISSAVEVFQKVIQKGKWEQKVLFFSFFIYFIWQCNAILHHGYQGQDFGAHVTWISQAKANPLLWLTTYDFTRTNPPLYHFLASIIVSLTNSIHSIECVSFFYMLLNISALFILYRIIKHIIISPVLRTAYMILMLFMPFVMISAVVIAADAMATPLFIVIIYLFTLLTEPQSKIKFAMLATGITLFLMIALAVKFTFISLVPASLLIFVALYRARYLTLRRTIIGILLVLTTGLFGYAEFNQLFKGQKNFNLGVLPINKWPNPIKSPYMNLRALMFPKSIDKDLLRAPPYYMKNNNNAYNLLFANKYSYPGLLHLAMYTDIMNVYQFDPHDEYFGPREARAQFQMKKAVKKGIKFSIIMAFFAPLMIILCISKFFRKKENVKVEKIWMVSTIIAVISCSFFLNIVGFFPFVGGVYGGGYWLPRLVAPALVCFFALAFAFVDRYFVTRFPMLAWVFLFFVIFQSSLHLSFLWPWGNNNPIAAVTLLLPENKPM